MEPTAPVAIPGAMSPEEHAARVAAIPPMNPALQELPVQSPYGIPPGGPDVAAPTVEQVGPAPGPDGDEEMSADALPSGEEPLTLGQLSPEQFSQQAQDMLEARATERGIELFRSRFPANYGPEAANDVSLLHEHAKDFAEAIYRLTGRRSPELTVAINKLQETIFWAEAALTRYDDVAPDITFITQTPAFPQEPQV